MVYDIDGTEKIDADRRSRMGQTPARETLMTPIIQTLAQDVLDGFISRNQAACSLSDLSGIPIEAAFDLIMNARQRLILKLAVRYEQEQFEDEDNARYESEYRLGAMR